MLKVTRFLNVSMIVRDLDAALSTYRDLFGLECAYRVEVPEMASDSAILPVGGGISYSVELVQPMDIGGSVSTESGSTYSGAQAAGIIQTFLDKRGEGIYRLAFEVEDFDAAVRHLEDSAVRYTYYDIDLPTGEGRVAIVHPKATKGVMFEFLPSGSYEPGAAFDTWPKGQTGIFRRFLNTSCAVRDLQDTLRVFGELFGLEASRVVSVPEMAVNSAVFTIGGDDVFEVFEPMRDDQKDLPRYNDGAATALSRYLDTRGEGVYRLALEVKDYDAALANLDASDVSYVPFDLELDTGPLRVAIVNPKAAHGVMFELCEQDNPAYS